MRWLTLTEIGRRARSKKGALKVSYEIWAQRYKATAKEYRQVLKDRKVGLGYDYCGLCRRYWPYCITKCPLGKSDKVCIKSLSLYSQARIALGKWAKTPTECNWRAWKRAAKALRDKLGNLIEEQNK